MTFLPSLDPLLIKELSGTSRRWQTYAFRGVYVAAIAAVVWNFSESFARSAGTLNPTVSAYARLGRDLFEAVFALQLVMVTLGAVTAAADMITKEVRAGTLGLLASTPLSPWRIAWGKWKAAMALTSTLLFCGAPALAIAVFLGGAGPRDLIYSMALSLAAAALGAAVGLFCSTLFRSGITAILVSIGILTAYALLPAILMDRYNASDFIFLCRVHPAFAAFGATQPQMQRVDPTIADAWISASFLTLAEAQLLLWWVSARIRKLSTRTPTPPILDRAFSAMDRFYEGLGSERIRRIRFFSDPGGVWETQAILWKELHTRSSGKLRNAVRISVLLLVLLAVSFWLSFDLMKIILCLSSGVLLFTGLSSGVGLFVKEKEERKWEILLATPLGSTDILRAKLLAGLVPMVPTALTLTLFWIAISWASHLHLGDFLITLATLFLTTLLAYAVGAACSLHARTLRAAFMTSFGLMGVFLLLVPIGIEYFSYDFNRYGPDRDLIACFNPAPYLVPILNTIGWDGSWYTFNLEPYLVSFTIFCVIYGGLIGGLLVFMNLRFDRVAGRTA